MWNFALLRDLSIRSDVTHRPENLLRQMPGLAGSQPSMLDVSVQYGAFHPSHPRPYALFYLRTDGSDSTGQPEESAESVKKLEGMRHRIVQSGFPVFQYSG